MADEKLPRSTVKSVEGKEKKGEFWKATVTLENGTTGIRYSKDEKVIDSLKEWQESGAEVEYNWTAGKEGAPAKIQVFLVKNEEEKKDTGKRKTEYTKKQEAKDDYWERKFEYEVSRQVVNDKKIEMQHYQNLVASVVAHKVTPDTTNEEFTTMLQYIDKAARILFDAHNPKPTAEA